MNPQDQNQPTPPQQPFVPNGASDDTAQQAAASYQTPEAPLQAAPVEQPQATYESSVPPVVEQPAQASQSAQPTQPLQSIESTPLSEQPVDALATDPTASPVAAPVTAQPEVAPVAEPAAKPAAKKTAVLIAVIVAVGILVGVAGYFILETL